MRMRNCVVLAEVLGMRSCVQKCTDLSFLASFFAYKWKNAVFNGDCMSNCVVLSEVLVMRSCVQKCTDLLILVSFCAYKR